MWTRPRTLIVVGIIAVAALTAAALWFGPWRNGDADATSPVAEARRSADDLTAAWTEGRLAEAPWAEGDIEDPAAVVALVTAGLGNADAPINPTVTVTAVTLGEDRTTATADLHLVWDLRTGSRWAYDTTIELVQPSRSGTPDADASGTDLDAEPAPRWGVVYHPTLVHPGLGEGEVFKVRRQLPRRGDIVDRDGRSLVAGRAGQVIVGIRPARIPADRDPAEVARTVAAHVGVDPEDLTRRVTEAAPDDVVEVLAMDQADYQRVRPQIHPIPGTVFEESSSGSELDERFARAVLGAVGPATAEVAEATGGLRQEGDPTGLGGIQLGQDEVLGGRAGLVIEATPLRDDGSPSPDGGRTLRSFPAEPGRDVVVTLDVDIQRAADAAVADTAEPSALVAIRPSTGDVVAVANGPTHYGGYNRAMIGMYPPGSVFKVVTALAFLEGGMTPDTVIDCPATFVAGKSFRNAGDGAFGPVSFRVNFARSCNTAFVRHHADVGTEELISTASLLGYRSLELGAPVFGGSIPPAEDLAEHASDMIGQGRVLASPLAVALASASVAAGRSLVPRLVVDPEVDHPSDDPLPSGAVASLQSLMRSVVTEGTGSALAATPGGEVHGKTGTAEYGTDQPPRTHAWFTGYQGDLAFAVLVEDSPGGAATAVPVAGRFLELVAASG